MDSKLVRILLILAVIAAVLWAVCWTIFLRGSPLWAQDYGWLIALVVILLPPIVSAGIVFAVLHVLIGSQKPDQQ